MKEITLVKKTPENILEDQDLLDELQDHVESIDMENDPDVTARTAHGVISCNLANGYGALRDALDSDDVRFQRLARFGGPRGGAPGEFEGVKGSQRRSRFLPRTCYKLRGFCYFGSQELIDKMDILGNSTNPSERKNL
ncbi:hypothetical protein C5167_044463 [Papaver somniferum]|uniref:Uncharacterized protein n=1 Tax=Papaver somniferum TaxID=3469 RepID=A0A4Y7L9I1_PAPSO|nr:hypothetical protein C5167_044463 [Papaver somniferum]